MPWPAFFPRGRAAWRRGLALAAALPGLGAAPPPDARAPDAPPEPPSTVEMARIDLGGSYYRGTMLVGYGSRAPVQGAVGALRLDVLRFPLPWLGFEIGTRMGPSAATLDRRFDGGFEGAVDVAPLSWSRPFAGSVLVGVGAGFGTSRPTWLDAEVQAYPLFLGRLRLFTTPEIGLHLGYRMVPVTTDALHVQAHEIELAVSVTWVQIGARGRIDVATGGDPERAYLGIWGGPFLGAAFY